MSQSSKDAPLKIKGYIKGLPPGKNQRSRPDEDGGENTMGCILLQTTGDGAVMLSADLPEAP